MNLIDWRTLIILAVVATGATMMLLLLGLTLFSLANPCSVPGRC
jgi:hypothetical protein